MAEPRALSPEPLNLAPALVGAPLATPARRALALAIDLAVLGLLSAASGYGLALALGVLALAVGRALRAEGARQLLVRALVGVLLLAALAVAWTTWRPGSGADAAAELAAEVETLRAEARPQPAEASATAPDLATLNRRLDTLQRRADAMAAAHERRSLFVRAEALADEIGLGFGWGIVYFSLLPAWWSGQTLGKRMLGLRVVTLSGRPLTPLVALKRYGGYAAGLATGGLGFAQVLWEPNRQALHDKAAHTVVLDTRRVTPLNTPAGPAPEES